MSRWRLTKIKRNGLSAPSRTSSLGSSSPWWTLGPTSLRPGHTFGGEMWPGGAWHCSLSACLALFVVWPLQVCTQTRASISPFLAKFSVHTTSLFRETMRIRKISYLIRWFKSWGQGPVQFLRGETKARRLGIVFWPHPASRLHIFGIPLHDSYCHLSRPEPGKQKKYVLCSLWAQNETCNT